MISGNTGGGVEVSHTTTPSATRSSTTSSAPTLTGTRVPAFTHNSEQGVHVEDGVQNTVIDGNVIGDNLLGNIVIEGVSTSGTQVTNNRIGVSSTGALLPNGSPWGIQIRFHAQRTTISGNAIADSPVGIRVDDFDNDFNTISRNSIFGITGGGLGIDLAPIGAVNPNDPGDADAGANQQMNFPVLTSAGTDVTGTSCPGCIVELFVADGSAAQRLGQDVHRLHRGRRHDGSFTIPIGTGLRRRRHHQHGHRHGGQHVRVLGEHRRHLPPPPPDTTASDDFTRIVSGGWGTADTGGAWTSVAGSPGDYNVDGSVGTISLPNAGTPTRGMVLGSVSIQDVDVLAKVEPRQAADRLVACT